MAFSDDKVLEAWFILLLTPLLILVGCTKPQGVKPASNVAVRESSDHRHYVEGRSSTYLLDADDYPKFQPGRKKNDVLNDVQWRGNLEMATVYHGNSVCAIEFGILGGPYSDQGNSVWAIFVADKFEKFVPRPDWGAKTFKVGDFSRLIRAIENEPLDVVEFEKGLKADSGPTRSIDPGLTAAWLLLRGPVEARMKSSIATNSKLRDQFNASRLSVGMAESEIESLVGARPIESGEVAAGAFRIYGSAEEVDVISGLHYSNILVVFKNGTAIGIYSGSSMPGGERGLQEIGDWFLDLPAR